MARGAERTRSVTRSTRLLESNDKLRTTGCTYDALWTRANIQFKYLKPPDIPLQREYLKLFTSHIRITPSSLKWFRNGQILQTIFSLPYEWKNNGKHLRLLWGECMGCEDMEWQGYQELNLKGEQIWRWREKIEWYICCHSYVVQ